MYLFIEFLILLLFILHLFYSNYTPDLQHHALHTQLESCPFGQGAPCRAGRQVCKEIKVTYSGGSHEVTHKKVGNYSWKVVRKRPRRKIASPPTHTPMTQ